MSLHLNGKNTNSVDLVPVDDLRRFLQIHYPNMIDAPLQNLTTRRILSELYWKITWAILAGRRVYICYSCQAEFESDDPGNHMCQCEIDKISRAFGSSYGLRIAKAQKVTA